MIIDNKNEFEKTQEQFKEKVQLQVNSKQYDFITSEMARSENPQETELKIASALKFSKEYGLPVDFAINNLDNLNQALTGSAFKPTPTNFKSITNSFEIGNLTSKRGELGTKLALAELKGEDNKELRSQIADLDQQIQGLIDYVPRNTVTTALKIGAQTLPYAGQVITTGLLSGGAAKVGLEVAGAALGGPIAGAAKVISIAASIGRGLKTIELVGGAEYYDLTEQGIDKGTARAIATISGGLSASIEAYLGGLGSSALGAFGVPIEGVTARAMAKLSLTGKMGAWGSTAVRYLGTSIEEGLEEFTEEIKDDIMESIAFAVDDLERPIQDVPLLERSIESFAQGFVASLVLGGAGSLISGKRDAKYTQSLKADAKETLSKEAFLKEHESEVPEGVDIEDWKDELSTIYDKQAPQREEVSAILKKRAVDVTEDIELDEEGEPIETPTKRTGNIERLKTGDIYTQESPTVERLPGGGELRTLKTGSPSTGESYGYIDFSLKDGTLEIQGVRSFEGYEELEQESLTSLIKRYPDLDIKWDPKNEFDRELKQKIIEANPRGIEAGLNYGQIKTDPQLINKLNDVFNLNTSESSAMAALVTLIGEKEGIPADKWLNQNIADIKKFKVEGKRGGTQFIETAEGVKAILYAGKNSDVTTFDHEVVHVIMQQSTHEEEFSNLFKKVKDTEQFKTFVDENKDLIKNRDLETLYKDPKAEWTRSEKEFVAELHEAYRRKGKTNNAELNEFFKRISEWFKNIYQSIRPTADLNDEIIDFFDSFYAKKEEVVETKDKPSQVNIKGETLFQSEDKDTTVLNKKGTLVVLHNISEGNLKKVYEIGGMPMPSLAVTTPESEHTAFGEITLIGDKAMGERLLAEGDIYSRDIWSPTVPRPSYKVDTVGLNKKFSELDKKVKPELRVVTGSGFRFFNETSFYNYEEEIERAKNNYGYKDLFLQEKGIDLKAPYKKESDLPPNDLKLFTSLNSKLKEGVNLNEDLKESDFKEDITADLIEYSREKWENLKETGGFSKKYFKSIENYTNRFKNNNLRDYKNYLKAYKSGKKEKDINKFEKNIDKKFTKKLTKEYEEWISNLLKPYWSDKGLLVDESLEDYNIENIFRSMLKENLKGNTSINYNFKVAAASAAKQFKTRKELSKAEDLLTPKEGISNKLKQLEDDYIKNIYKASINKRDYEYLDDSARVIGEYLNKAKDPSIAKFKTALKKYNFNPEVNNIANRGLLFAEALRTAPRNYFEAKPKEILQPSSFKAAIVPKGTDRTLIKRLKEDGITVKTYEGENQGEVTENYIKKNIKTILFQSEDESWKDSIEKYNNFEDFYEAFKSFNEEEIPEEELKEIWINNKPVEPTGTAPLDIKEEVSQSLAGVGITDRLEAVKDIEDEELKESILAGKETVKGKTEETIEKQNEEIIKEENKKKAISSELNSLRKRLKKASPEVLIVTDKINEINDNLNKNKIELNKINKKVTKAATGNEAISNEDIKKRDSLLLEKSSLDKELKKLEEELKYKTATLERWKAAKKINELRKRQEKQIEKIKTVYKKRDDLRKVKAYKEKLSRMIMKTPSKNVLYKNAEEIQAIQALVDPNFRRSITIDGKSWSIDVLKNIFKENPNNTLFDSLSIEKLGILAKKDLNEWTIEDLEDIASAVNILRKEGLQLRQAQIDIENSNAEYLKRKVISEILKSGKFTASTLYGTEKEKKKETRLLQRYRNTMYTTYNMARKSQILDNNKKGPVYDLLIRKKRDLQAVELRAMKERSNKVMNIIKDLKIKTYDLFDLYEINIDEQIEKLSFSQLAYIYLSQNNERNKAAISYGSFVSKTEKESARSQAFKLYPGQDIESNKLRREKQNQIVTELGDNRYNQVLKQATEVMEKKPDLLKVVKAIESDFNAGHIKKINELMLKVYNTSVEAEDYYLPINRDDFVGEAPAEQIKKDVLNTVPGLKASPEKGFTKSRVDISPINQTNIKYDLFNIWQDNVFMQEHALANIEYIRELNKVFTNRGSKTLREYISNSYGTSIMRDIDQHIQEVANPQSFNKLSDTDKMIRTLRGSLYTAYLGYKTSSVVLQAITSPAPFLGAINPAQLAQGYFKLATKPVETWNMIKELSPFMENRSMDILPGFIRDELKKIGTRKSKRLLLDFENIGMKGLEWIDRFTVAGGWYAIYQSELSKLEGGPIEENIKIAAKKADEYVQETQPQGDITELAPLFKNKNEALNLITQFQSSLNVIWQNVTYDVPTALKNHEYKKAIGTIAGYMIAGSLLYAVKEGFDDDDDKKKWQELIYSTTSQITSGVPLVSRELDNLVKHLITGESSYSYGVSLYPSFDKMIKALNNITAKNYEKALYNTLQAVALSTGLPYSGAKELISIKDEGLGALVGRRNYDK